MTNKQPRKAEGVCAFPYQERRATLRDLLNAASPRLTALAALGRLVVGRLAQGDVGTGADGRLGAVAAVERLAGYDSVDLWSGPNVSHPLFFAYASGANVPVRIFWNASSTLLASRADVSMKDRWFSPARIGTSAETSEQCARHPRHTSKRLGLLGRNSTQVPQVTLVSDQHNDNVGISVVAKLL